MAKGNGWEEAVEHFLTGSIPTVPVTDGIAWRQTDSYVEAKLQMPGDSQWLPAYVLTASEGVGAAATCWDHQFDAFVDQLTNPEIVKIWRRIYPTWFACVDHAMTERYGEGALVELLDPDEMSRKWMIAVLFSRRAKDLNNAAAVALDRVVKISTLLAEELLRKPSKMDYVRAAAGGLVRGAVQGSAQANRIRDAFGWIPDAKA